MVKLIPSILSADFFNLGQAVTQLQKGGADGIHIDVMDGHFVPNISIGPMVLKAIKAHVNMFMDVHLMIENPEDYIRVFAQAGADSITVHMETMRHPLRVLDMIKGYNMKAAVALNPATPLASLEYVMDEVDMVLLMTVNPGFGGQRFIPSMMSKISELKNIRDKRALEFDIEVDGGINLDNVHEVILAGANVIVTGSAIVSEGDITKNASAFKCRMTEGMSL